MHARRHLIDETEHAFITAGTVFAHQSVLEFYPKLVVVVFIDLQKPFYPGRLADQYFDVFIFHQITVVKDIFNFLTVYF